MVVEADENVISHNRALLTMALSHILNKVDPCDRTKIAAQTDTVYNNYVTGHGFSSPGTQSTTTTTTTYIECEINKKVLIRMKAFNQLCSGGPKCEHTNCGINFDPNSSIDSTEKSVSYDIYMKCDHENVEVVEY